MAMTMNREPESLFDTADLSGLTDDDFLFPEDWNDYEDERQIAAELEAEAQMAQYDDDPNPYAGDYSDGGEDAYLDSYWESLYEQ